MSELADAIIAMARQRGLDPRDVATAMSYETGGTFDPWKAGPTTQWGQHRGLIQWGEPQRRQYGVSQNTPIAAQVDAAGRYLVDAGVKPGMGLMDIYSAINAGHVGRYNASDANNGGAPGTVADKVNTQMAGHRANAEKLLGGQLGDVVASPAAAPQPAQPSIFADPGQSGPPGFRQVAAMLVQTQNATQQRQDEEAAAEAERARKEALFGGGVAGLYG